MNSTDKHIEEQIIKAFFGTPVPEGKLCIDEYDYDDTHGYFAGTTWQEHDVADLRRHESSLIYFTPEAFRYYLPAFMLAEIRDPETADIIAENMAFLFVEGPYKNERIALFNKQQLEAIVAFFENCAARYPDGIYDVEFLKAANEVRKAIGGRTGF